LYRKNIIASIEFEDVIREDLIFNLSVLSHDSNLKYITIPYAGYSWRQNPNSEFHSKYEWPYSKVIRSISRINELINKIDDLCCKEVYSSIIYILLIDAFARLEYRRERYTHNKGYIKGVLNQVNKKLLSFKCAQNWIQKITYFAKCYEWINLYMAILSIIYK